MCGIPVVDNALPQLFIKAYLNRNIGEWVAIVEIAPLICVKNLDVDLFVIPRKGRYMAVGLFVAIKSAVAWIWMILIVVEKKLHNLFRSLLHPFHIKSNFSANHVFRVSIFGIAIGIVRRTAMAAGNDDAVARFGLDIIDQLN